MDNAITFNRSESLKKTFEKQLLVEQLKEQLSQAEYDLQELKKANAANISIQWKESIRWCLESSSNDSSYFIKTPSFISDCVVWKHGVEVTKDIKNKIATTLSLMFNQGEIGRIQKNGKTYYGLAKFFKKDMISLKAEYVDWFNDLLQ